MEVFSPHHFENVCALEPKVETDRTVLFVPSSCLESINRNFKPAKGREMLDWSLWWS